MTKDDAAFKACYAEWKVIKTRAMVQLVFEIPIEKADEAYQVLGGMPIAAHEVWGIMIDFFGWKARAELAAYKEMLNREHKAYTMLSEANDNLIRQLREMDQLVFTLGQSYTGKESQGFRRALAQLAAESAKRQHAESDRIRDVLIPEVRKVYSGPAFSHEEFRRFNQGSEEIDWDNLAEKRLEQK